MSEAASTLLPVALGSLVVGALVLLALRRGLIAPPRGASDAPLKVEQALPLGPGARLLVVDMAGRRLLLAQDRHGLRQLATAPDAAEVPR